MNINTCCYNIMKLRPHHTTASRRSHHTAAHYTITPKLRSHHTTAYPCVFVDGLSTSQYKLSANSNSYQHNTHTIMMYVCAKTIVIYSEPGASYLSLEAFRLSTTVAKVHVRCKCKLTFKNRNISVKASSSACITKKYNIIFKTIEK
jgi:hypothetical protein